MTSKKILQLEGYLNNKERVVPLTLNELEQMANEGYSVAGGGPIPSDYDGNIPKTHQLNGEGIK